MNDLDMELQTIRQKLQTLKAYPQETVASPWEQSRFAAPSPNFAQVTTAIAALRKRSEHPQTRNNPGLSLQQFDAVLTTINSLAQQQLHALQRLQAVGDGLIYQTQSGLSPEIDDISRFFGHCSTLKVPTVQRDPEGYLAVDYHTLNFRKAEYDATSNAETLRMRSQLFQAPLAQSQQPYTRGKKDRYTYSSSHSPNSVSEELSIFFRLVYNSIRGWTQQLFPRNQQPYFQQFTFLDGMIWLIGAIIVRIILHQIFQLYPGLWMPVALLLIAGLTIALYKAILSPRPNSVLDYRLIIFVLGLLVGGHFL